MERAVRVGKRIINLKATADSLIIYKSNFERDGLNDIFTLSPSAPEAAANTYLRITWAFAKSKDPNLIDYDRWLMSFTMPAINLAIVLMPQVADIVKSFTKTTIKSKKLSSKGKSSIPTTETIIRRAIERGLTVADFSSMSLGMVIDYLVSCQNEDMETRKENGGNVATEAQALAW